VQALHRIPHEFVLVLSTQMLLQLCVAAGQAPQAWLEGMQAPLQRLCPMGHVPPQVVPSHVALPPVMLGHAKQDDAPQEPTSVLLTHFVPHR
jgi:hypothetical protein